MLHLRSLDIFTSSFRDSLLGLVDSVLPLPLDGYFHYDTIASLIEPLLRPTRGRQSVQDGHIRYVYCDYNLARANDIPGLLPLLKSIHKPCNLKKFAGKTIGIDAYGWLHRGTAACAIDLALDKPTTKYATHTLFTELTADV